jgi:hypothetical protein
MKLNTKQIFQDDPKNDVINKVNYNFDQILSFGVGPDGHMGPKGATGMFGPAGKKGATGLSGPRGNKWDSGENQPYESVEYDLWIKDSGDLDFYSATGSWNFTGFNFYNSLYFKLYNGIEGPAGVTDKYVIGFKDTLPGLASDYSFVVGDSSLSTLDSNPNKSKLVVSVDDQVTRPLFSFLKSGSSSSGFPSFYWNSLGNSNNLILESSGNLNIVSYLSLKVNTATNGRILLDSYKAIINSQSRAYFTGNGDLSFNTNTTIGLGSTFVVNSSRLSITTTQFIANSSFYIRTYNFGSTGGYALNSNPIYAILDGGIKLDVYASLFDQPKADRIFQFKDLSGSSVLSARPSSSSSTAGDIGQVIFGSTGSSAGATAGPYTYHVSKASLLKYATIYRTNVRAAQNNCTGALATIHNIFQIIKLPNNVTVISPTSRTSTSLNSIYLEIPTSYLSNLDAIYSASHVNPYRIILDDLSANPSTLYIKGIVFNFSINTSSAGCYQYVNFNTTPDQTCRFVDIIYLPPANSYNPNPRIFYKTCNGTSGYVNMGSVYPISSPPLIPPLLTISLGE